MPRKRIQDLVPGFAKGMVRTHFNFVTGINYEQPDFQALPENSLILANDIRLTTEGAIQKCHGSRRLHASAIDGVQAIMGGFSWRQGNGTVTQLVTTDNLFTGSYAIPATWTSRAGALDGTKYHSFAAFRDGSGEVVYIADGGLLNKWTGAAVSVDLAGTPSVSRIVAYNQRLFGISGTDQTLYWSALNNGDSLGVAASGGGSAVVRTYGGQHLTGLAVVGGSLLLFHANAISRFTGYSQTDINIDAGAVGHGADVGTLAPRSIVVINHEGSDVALFMTRRGLYMANESGVSPVPCPFDRDILALANNQWDQIEAVHDKTNREVWFKIVGFIWAYRYDLGAWVGPRPQILGAAGSPNVMWAAEDDNGAPAILAGALDGFVRHCDYPSSTLKDILSDNTGGSATTMIAEARPMFFGDESLEKLFRWLYVTGQAVNGVGNVTVDWTTSTGETGSTSLLLPSNYGTIAVPLAGRGTYLRVKLTDNGSGGASMIFGLRAEGFALGRRR